MTASRILVTCGHLQRHIGRYEAEIRDHGVDLWVPQLIGQQFDAAAMAAMLPEVDTVVAGDDDLTGATIESGARGRLRSIVKWGIGTDNVDKVTAARLGIHVYNTPGMFSDEVADLALGHVLCLARHLHRMDRAVRTGAWSRYEGTSLSGKTAGIVGLGGIGRAIAKRCTAFGMSVVGCDVATIEPSSLSACGAAQAPFETVLERADILILACSLTAENRHLMNDAAFARMKHGAMLVNVARGPIVDEAALVTALESGKIGSAGLDVFEVEPLPPDSPLRGFDNCLFGTHAGSGTLEAVQRVNRITIDIALALLGIDDHRLDGFNRVA